MWKKDGDCISVRKLNVFLLFNNLLRESKWIIGSLFLMFSSRHVKGGYKWLHPLTRHQPFFNLLQWTVV